jgi:hypothetical protein
MEKHGFWRVAMKYDSVLLADDGRCSSGVLPWTRLAKLHAGSNNEFVGERTLVRRTPFHRKFGLQALDVTED